MTLFELEHTAVCLNALLRLFFFFFKFKETVSGHQCGPRLPKLLWLMGEAYALHDPYVCHSQICF